MDSFNDQYFRRLHSLVHDPWDRTAVPAPYDLFPGRVCALLENSETTLCWNIFNADEISNCLPDRILDDTVFVLDFKYIG
jgi:hypothetical protein